MPILKYGRLKLGDYQIKYYCNWEGRTEAQLTHAPLTQIRLFFCEMKSFRINCGKNRQKQTENPSSEAAQKNSR